MENGKEVSRTKTVPVRAGQLVQVDLLSSAASDEASLRDAKTAVIVSFEGDSRVRVIKTHFPDPHDPRWVAICNYYVRVPRGVSVKVASKAMDHVRLMQLTNQFVGHVRRLFHHPRHPKHAGSNCEGGITLFGNWSRIDWPFTVRAVVGS